MQALILYDLTGTIWNIIYGSSQIPQGIPCLKADIPENAQLDRIDLSDPQNPKPIFHYLPETDYGRMENQIKDLEDQLSGVQSTLAEQSQRNALLEAELSDTQLALTELYEGMEV